MLASGYSPVLPAHVPLAEFKNKCVGTGPFKLKENRPGELIEYVKNPDYFIKGRPYLDGLKFVVIRDRSTQIAALQSGQLDVAGSGWNRTNAEDAKGGAPKLVVRRGGQNVNDNVLINFKKPPFTDLRVRHAINLALDRKAYLVGPRQGAATFGGALLPRPAGVWGLPAAEVAKLPGMGDPAKQKAEARKLLAEAGFGPSNPLKITVSTRALRDLRRHRELDGGPAPAGRHRGDARADRDGRVAPEDDAARVPGRAEPHRRRHRRSRRPALRELPLRLAAQLLRLLLGGDRPADGRAVADDSTRRSAWLWSTRSTASSRRTARGRSSAGASSTGCTGRT